MAEISKPQPQQPPFTPEPTLFSTSSMADELEENIPTMGAQGPNPNISEKPVRVEQEFEYSERRSFPTTTTPAYYDVQTTNPKIIRIIAEGDDHLVDFNDQISTDSPKIFKSTYQDFTAKGVTRIWFQANATSGTIRILVFKQ
jgi:hypothetical protein